MELNKRTPEDMSLYYANKIFALQGEIKTLKRENTLLWKTVIKQGKNYNELLKKVNQNHEWE